MVFIEKILGLNALILNAFSPGQASGLFGILNQVELLSQAGIGSVLVETVKLLLVVLAPFVGFAIVIHWLERITEGRLAERFGWKSVLWTGWLGTPIHELSHAFMCWVFRHKIKEIALFEPDQKSGRLGYVVHSFDKRNKFQRIGNFFIGIAPLIGGSIALALLLWMFYPDAARSAIELTGAEAEGDAIEKSLGVVSTIFGSVINFRNVVSVRFWAFIYLVLCVGTHMAPSPSDYEGAWNGVFIFGAVLIAGVFLLALAGVDSQRLVNTMIGTMGPLFAILGLTVVLCAIAAVIVYGVTAFFPQKYRTR